MRHFSICEHCERSFRSQQGLDNHQSRTDSNHLACNRAKKLREDKEKKALDHHRKVRSSQVHLVYGKEIPDVSEGPHSSGSPIDASQKKCILNLFQSFCNDGLNTTNARIETAKRLQFSEHSVTQIVKEKLATGAVTSNSKNNPLKNAYEKLSDEEIEFLRKSVRIFHSFFVKNSVKLTFHFHHRRLEKFNKSWSRF